jgi:hypothetical protein
MRKVGDRLSMALLAVVGAGTLGALVLTSAAKKMGLTGAPPKGASAPGAPSTEKDFQERLKALEKT